MIGLLIPASDAETVFISFSRSTGSRRFTAREMRALSAAPSSSPPPSPATARSPGRWPAATSRRPPRPSPTGPPSGLTAREAQVVNLMLEGHSARAIGEALRISNETVRVHRRNIYEKLGLSSQAELFRWFLASRA